MAVTVPVVVVDAVLVDVVVVGTVTVEVVDAVEVVVVGTVDVEVVVAVDVSVDVVAVVSVDVVVDLLVEVDVCVVVEDFVELLLVVDELGAAGQVWVRLNTVASLPVGVPRPLSAWASASSRTVPGAADAKKNLAFWLEMVPLTPLDGLLSNHTVGAGAVKNRPESPAAGSTNTK